MSKLSIRFIFGILIMPCIIVCTNCNKEDFDDLKCIEKFDFSVLQSYPSVAQNIKETCDSIWDLCNMNDSTFKVSVLKNNEFSIVCDGFIDIDLIRYRIWTDPQGNLIKHVYYQRYFLWPYCIELFNFPINDSIDPLVYEEIKLTCDEVWDLCNMIETTFTIEKDHSDYIVRADGIEENHLYEFFLG